MFSLRSRRCRPVFAAVAVVALGACGQDNPLAPDLRSTPETGPRRSTTANQAVGGNITIAQCSGPAGTYTYHVGVQGGGNFSLPGSADRTMVFPGPVNCSVGGLVTGYIANNSDTWSGAAATAKVTISATALPPEAQVDSIQYRINGVMQPTLRLRKSVTLNVSFSDEIIVAFWSGHTPQGCGNGYWKAKQHYGEGTG